MTNRELMEGTDKAEFLRWLHAEMNIFGEQIAPAERDIEINRLCQRWLRFKIAGARRAELADAGWSDAELRSAGRTPEHAREGENDMERVRR